MAITANPARPKPTLMCIGSVNIVTDRDTGELKVYQKPLKDDETQPGHIIIQLQFTPDPATAGLSIRAYPFLHPEQFNPNNNGSEFKSWHQENWDKFFISNGGGVALFEFLASQKGVNLSALEDAYNADTGATDCRAVGKFLSDLCTQDGEPILVGYILRQEKEKGVLTDRYRVDGFFDPEKPPKSQKMQRTFN